MVNGRCERSEIPGARSQRWSNCDLEFQYRYQIPLKGSGVLSMTPSTAIPTGWNLGLRQSGVLR
jgi:hypothetical protein